MKNYSQAFIQYFVIIAIVLLFLTIVEITSRIYICQFAPFAIFQKYALPNQCGTPPRLIPHHYLSYQGNPEFKSYNGDRHNALGFRGPEIANPKPKGRYRVIIVGGSTVYETGVDHYRNDFARNIETFLQDKYDTKNIEVISGGISGYTSWESLISLEMKLVDLEPDLLVFYDNLNDAEARMVDPNSYKGDNSGRRIIYGSDFPFFEKFAFIRLLTKYQIGLEQLTAAPTSAFYIFHYKSKQDLELFGKELGDLLKKNPPIYFERNLRSMIAISKEFKSDVMLATFAFSDQFEGYVSAPIFQTAINEHNIIIKNVAISHGVKLYDHALKFPKEKKYWSDGAHVNEIGVKLKARLFSDFILKNWGKKINKTADPGRGLEI